MGVDGRAVYHQVVSFDTLPYYWSLLERHYHIRVDRWNKPCREYARPLGNEYSELQSEPQDFTLLSLYYLQIFFLLVILKYILSDLD